MSWANVGSLSGAGGGGAALTSVWHQTTLREVPVGGIVLTGVFIDNTNATDGNFGEVTSVTDSTGGNVWTKIAEFTNGQGAAAAGCTVAVFMTQASTIIPVGATITADISSVAARGIASHLLSIGAGNTVSIAGTVQTLANDAAAAGSMSISGLSSGEYLFFRALAGEKRTYGTFLPTSGYAAAFVGYGYDGGSNDTSINSAGEFDIATGTGSTSAPTTDAVDWASVFFALQEVPQTSTLFFGGGV